MAIISVFHTFHFLDDFCGFKSVTYVALTLCYKLWSFLHWMFMQLSSRTVRSRSRTTVDCTTAVLRTWRAYQQLNKRSPVSTSMLLRLSVTLQVSH